ncbi:hypothetical protein BKA62DRAFT_830334 [Auriculariales sp. MPI-PUGE-AT-0066]|nr:hypothetical protein BKA62DRAFT_830334 [Auriculariales sp. MPI-PUGE-AT-0066]
MATIVIPSSPIPSISISFAPAEDLPAEPYSPFNSISFGVDRNLDSPRAMHLAPPMTGSTRQPSPLSGARKTPANGGKGLDRARFESLLRSTRERAQNQQQQQQQQQQQARVLPALVGGALDLRKQAALKAHSSKQADRRARFLSKIEAPPSPSATDVPVTPPESPVTLALVDPPQKRSGWIERIEFNAPKSAPLAQPLSPRKPLPSLDQISARISSQHRQQQQHTGPKRVRLPIGAAPVPVRAPIPLPAFLRSQQRSPSPPTPKATTIPLSPAAPARLPLPSLGIPSSAAPRRHLHLTRALTSAAHAATAVTEANLNLLESRNEMSKAMLEKIMRRVSSPAELQRAGRRHGEVFGEHRMLAVPGGF